MDKSDWVQLADELHKPADLVDMQPYSPWNKGYKYLLTVIDVFFFFLSKYAWVVPIKDKKGATIKNAFSGIIKKEQAQARVFVDG